MEQAVLELSNLFEEAKERSEFDFILTLINYRSINSKQAQSNLHEWFDAIEFYKRQYRALDGKEKTRMAALLYSTFFENSDFYNIVGSLCKIKLGFKGSSYLYWKTKKYERLLGIGEKEDFLVELLDHAGKPNIISFFTDNHEKAIRNTYFHSAYSIEGGVYIMHDGEKVVINGVNYSEFNIQDFFYPKVENVILFFDAFKKGYLDSFNSYQVDKEIDGNFPHPVRITVLGSAEGLKGFKAKKAVQMFGQWHDSGIWFDPGYGFWAGHNIRIDFPSIETVEIGESLTRYEGKADIIRNDKEFHNLIDKIVERNNAGEISRATHLLVKFGDARKAKMLAEKDNPFLQKATAKSLLPFYLKAVEIGSAIHDMTTINKDIATIEKFLAR